MDPSPLWSMQCHPGWGLYYTHFNPFCAWTQLLWRHFLLQSDRVSRHHTAMGRDTLWGHACQAWTPLTIPFKHKNQRRQQKHTTTHCITCIVRSELSNLDTRGRSGHFDRTGGQIRSPTPSNRSTLPLPRLDPPSWMDRTSRPPFSGHHNRGIWFPQFYFCSFLFWI